MYRSSLAIVPEREGATKDTLLHLFVQRLDTARARKVTIGDGVVSFRGGFFRLASSWNLLVPVTSGQIEYDMRTDQITYSLTFTELQIIGTAMAGIMGVVMVASDAPSTFLFCGLPVMWLWLVGMNYLISLGRFDRFMRHCIRDAGFAIVRRRPRIEPPDKAN